MFVAAIVYIYNQFLPLPDFLVIIAHASWICVHGKDFFKNFEQTFKWDILENFLFYFREVCLSMMSPLKMLKLINFQPKIIFSGDTPIVYLILNQPLRKAVFKLIRNLTVNIL